MKSSLRKALSVVLLFSLLSMFTSCAFFLYPERRGRTAGHVDVPCLILDCGLLIFWVVPGVIALAVDFASGAIYASSGRGDEQGKQWADCERIECDTALLMDKHFLEQVVKERTGQTVDLSQAQLWSSGPMSRAELEQTLTSLP
ncbi:MAG: hypothetical protein BWY87_01358 [Deltaproteobacteria bacterium ADurb.Bin510]|nr:MAG: hypothetical protein BWY87_01358 [Deltaproteobacteria bacterium ADurb.Bin510]